MWRAYARGKSAGHTAGSGLGLSIVHDVADAAWRSRVDRGRPAEAGSASSSLAGADVRRRRERARRRSAGIDQPSGRLMARILVVEDNQQLAEGIAYNLRHEEHEPRVADDGRVGLDTVR